MHNFQVIDSHLHCGRQNVSWLWEDLRPLLLAAGIRGQPSSRRWFFYDYTRNQDRR